MQYLLTFLEGIITFISPCLLPMLPIYVSYFAAGEEGGRGRRTLLHALCFVLGFTTVFVALGAFAGTVGRLLQTFQRPLEIVGGGLVIVFGLSFLGLIRLPFFSGFAKGTQHRGKLNGFSAFLFGLIFSIGWTPCVGAFLGSALMLAANSGAVWQGVGLLLCFSLGLGIPFVVSALLIDKLKGAFDGIKRHYRVITWLSGGFLILVGLLMATGLLGRLLTLFI